ncbi:hypothetical protein U1Q18_012021 [Sarracenia purpurea var. burkii]
MKLQAARQHPANSGQRPGRETGVRRITIEEKKERLIGGDTDDPRGGEREAEEAATTDFGKLERDFRRFSERTSTGFGDCTSPASSVQAEKIL